MASCTIMVLILLVMTLTVAVYTSILGANPTHAQSFSKPASVVQTAAALTQFNNQLIRPELPQQEQQQQQNIKPINNILQPTATTTTAATAPASTSPSPIPDCTSNPQQCNSPL